MRGLVMLRRSARHTALLATICGVQLVFAGSAQAATAAFLNSNVLMLFQAAGAPNQCISFAYDKNGNITVRTNQAFGSQATWGSVKFGCFSWTSS
jgi:hypothetical protein